MALRLTVSALAILAALVPSTASALDCFEIMANPSPLTADPAAAHTSTLPVTLLTSFRVNARCAYGLSPDASRMDRVSEGETDFAALASTLATRTHADASIRPRTLYGRIATATGTLESMFRESCTEALLGGGFDAHVDTASASLVVSRSAPIPGADCGASRTVLRFFPVQDAVHEAPGLSNTPAPYTLVASARTVDLGSSGEFAVYAARTAASPGLLVGHVGHRDPLTALREAMVTLQPGGSPWFHPQWSAAGDFEFGLDSGLREGHELWSEIVTASAANELWLADAPTGDARAHAPRAYGPVSVGPSGESLVLPQSVVSEAMLRRFGPAGQSIVPTLGEWDDLRRGLQVCLVGRYVPERPSGNDPVPEGARCARLERLAAPVALASLDPQPGPRQVCLRRTRWEMSSRGAAAGITLDDRCIALPSTAPEGDSAADTSPVPTVMVGDRIEPVGTSSDLYVCIDNHCRPLHEITSVWQPGLVSVRSAPSVEAAAHAQGVSLVRLVAIDPVAGWLPTGLYTGRPLVPANPWASLDHDETSVFAFVRRRQSLTFRLATTPSAAAVWNARSLAAGQGAVLTDDLPIVGGMIGSPTAPPHSGLVVLVSRSERCPTASSGTVRAVVPVDPNALLVDQTFHVFLAHAADDAAPYECVAHATFRIRESRVVAPSSWFTAGLWGDTQLGVFLNSPAAIGAIQPVVYGHARLPWGFNLEAAVDLTAALTFANGETSRVGTGLSLALGWGPDNLLPRLLSAGLIASLATGTAATNPVLSPYLALDLSTLVDLMGGR